MSCRIPPALDTILSNSTKNEVLIALGKKDLIDNQRKVVEYGLDVLSTSAVIGFFSLVFFATVVLVRIFQSTPLGHTGSECLYASLAL